MHAEYMLYAGSLDTIPGKKNISTLVMKEETPHPTPPQHC